MCNYVYHLLPARNHAAGDGERDSSHSHYAVQQGSPGPVCHSWELPRLDSVYVCRGGDHSVKKSHDSLGASAISKNYLPGQTYHSRRQYYQAPLYANGLKENSSCELVGRDFPVPYSCLLYWV